MAVIEKQTTELSTPLSAAVTRLVERHLLALQGEKIVDLHKLVVEEVEAPLYRAVMEHCKYNQCRAALLLGVSRGTLRKMLSYYFGDQYVGTRGEA